MFGALKRGFRSMAGLILVRNVFGEFRPKRTLAASRGFLAAARLSCDKGARQWRGRRSRARRGGAGAPRVEVWGGAVAPVQYGVWGVALRKCSKSQR